MPIPVLVWWGGGLLAATLAGLRIRAVRAKHALESATNTGVAAGAAAVASGVPRAVAAPAPPAAVAAVTPVQVQQAAQAAGVSVADFSRAAQASGTTPQAVIAAAQSAGGSVADDIIAALAAAGPAQDLPTGTGPGTPSQTLVTGPSQQTARVTTNDPAPQGDLIIRSGPSASAPQIGGAEKDGVVVVLFKDAGEGFSEISWPGGSRLPAIDGFARTKFLDTSFNGEGSIDASEAYGKDYA